MVKVSKISGEKSIESGAQVVDTTRFKLDRRDSRRGPRNEYGYNPRIYGRFGQRLHYVSCDIRRVIVTMAL
jgi:hypothetical protein